MKVLNHGGLERQVAEPGKCPYFVLHMKPSQLAQQLTIDGLRWKIKMVRGKFAHSNSSGNHLSYGDCKHLKDGQMCEMQCIGSASSTKQQG